MPLWFRSHYPFVRVRIRVGGAHIRLGLSTHKNAREPDLETYTLREFWAHFCETAAPAGVQCGELGDVTGQARLDHRKSPYRNPPDTPGSWGWKEAGQSQAVTC